MEKNMVKKYTASRIFLILGNGDQGAQKAHLAELRRGIGKEPGELPALWGAFLEDIPQELLNPNGEISYAEWSIYTALTLFALHQQGHDPKESPMYLSGKTFGAAVAELVTSEDEEQRILRRFNMAATSTERAEMAHHLRGIIQLLRAESIPLDYGTLAEDLFWYQFPESQAKVRLRWGQDYYMNRKVENHE